MSKDKYYQLVVMCNEYVLAVPLIYLHDDKIEYYYKQDIVTNI